MSKKENCPLCGAVGTVSTKIGPFQAKFKTQSITLDGVAMSHCSSCKGEFFDREQSRALDDRVRAQTQGAGAC